MDIEEKDLLQYAISQGIIDLEDVRNNMIQKEQENILKKHPYEIWETSDGRWRTYLPDESKLHKRRAIARKSEKKLRDDIIKFYTASEDDKYISMTDPTLAEIYPEWISYRNTLTRSSSTIKRFKSVWNTWYKDKEITALHLSDLNYLYLNKWANSIVKDNNLNKKQYYLVICIIKQMLEYAVDKQIINDNPFDKVSVSKKMFQHNKKPDSKDQVFLEKEQMLIADAAREKYSHRPWCITPLLVLLNFQLGLRIGELVSLKWKDVNGNYITISRMETTTFSVGENGEVVSDGYKVVPYVKSEAGYREVYLNSVAKALLQEIRKAALRYDYFDDGFIFIASRLKTRGTSRTFTKYLESLCNYAGVRNKSNHKIRKTYISSLFDSGVNINTIRVQAGHEDEKTSLNNYCFDQKDEPERERELEKAANQKMII